MCARRVHTAFGLINPGAGKMQRVFQAGHATGGTQVFNTEPVMAFVGDSIYADGDDDSIWFNASAGAVIGAINGDLLRGTENIAVGGTSSFNLLISEDPGTGPVPAQINAIEALTYSPAVIRVCSGSNDAFADVSPATVVSNITTFVSRARAAHPDSIIEVCTPFVRNDWLMTQPPFNAATIRANIDSYAAAIRALPAGPSENINYIIDQHGFTWWSADGVNVSTAYSNGGLGDAGVHPNVLGGIQLAVLARTAFATADYLQRLTPLNPTGLITGSGVSGNTGVANGTITGLLPENWIGIGTELDGVALVGSKVNPLAEDTLLLTCSGTANPAGLSYAYLFGDAVALTAGQTVRARAKVNLNAVGLCGCAVGLWDGAGWLAQGFKFTGNVEEDSLIPAGVDTFIYSPSVEVETTGNHNIGLELVFRQGVGVSGTALIESVEIEQL
jgi:hypothetical protein